jgi:hypothetical protein
MALPGGTTNQTGKDLGPWSSVEVGLEALEEAGVMGPEEGAGAGDSGGGGASSWTGKVRERSVLRVEGAPEGTVCGMFFGAGAVAEGIRVWHERFDREDLPGNAALRSTIFHLLKRLAFGGRDGTGLAQPVTWSVAGDADSRHRALLCLVSTMDRLILGFTPFWGREVGPIHFTLVDEKARGFWWRLWRLARGRPGRALTPERGYFSQDAGTVTLSFDGPFVVDGEVFMADSGSGGLTLSAITGVRWLVPG